MTIQELQPLETLKSVALSYGYDLEECLNAAWNEIKDRTGKMIDGTFVKDS